MKNDIQPAELSKRLQSGESLRIIDVRSPLEFKSGHVPGAENIPLQTITDTIPNAAPNQQIIFVCQGGVRSQAACQKVERQYPNALNLVGGTSGWISAGLGVESVPKEPMSISRQTHLVAGLILVTAFALHHWVASRWIYLATLPAFGLLLDATTGICLMSIILEKMPWNKNRKCEQE